MFWRDLLILIKLVKITGFKVKWKKVGFLTGRTEGGAGGNRGQEQALVTRGGGRLRKESMEVWTQKNWRGSH